MSHHRPSYYPPASSARPAFNAPQSFPSNAPQSFPSNAPQAFSPWPPSDASMMNRPNVYGGRGGHGGPSLSKGGRGGLGGGNSGSDGRRPPVPRDPWRLRW
ncbi:hypothetical protein MSAN_00536200 [Mycena sanguinolenta]|uniref:Uncharacterized protein n=1 Tax=Mycena sanguinolenta TaxID=230812 RepID=A0A8H7DHE5_9AGAR|nr:hypothetical protein MSAN_00536200 [Mycena sanguinolenta]